MFFFIWNESIKQIQLIEHKIMLCLTKKRVKQKRANDKNVFNVNTETMAKFERIPCNAGTCQLSFEFPSVFNWKIFIIAVRSHYKVDNIFLLSSFH